MPVRRQESLSGVVAGGDTRRSLEALRDRLAVELESAEGSPVAALAKQLSDVLKTIAALPGGRERSIEDELADRREGRVKKAKPSKRARGTDVEGARRRRSGRTGGS